MTGFFEFWPTDRVAAYCPHYHLVPKGFTQNLAYRRELLRMGDGSKTDRQQFWQMCREDPLFWINAFVWIFEPRTSAVLPFITYPYQDTALLEILTAIGDHDLVIEKSRDMGASWLCLTAQAWQWQFHELRTFLWLSRKAELVEKRGDPKALFSKLDFILRREPAWLVPAYERREMHAENHWTGSTINGESTNTFAGVADRRTALLIDEFSKMPNQAAIATGTRDVTLSRIYNFTPQGSGNASYEIAHDPNFRKLTVHWSLHPIKRRGLYHYVAGELRVLDPTYYEDARRDATLRTKWPAGAGLEYPFSTDVPRNPRFGGMRSPWYDAECRRCRHTNEIAQELDIDYLGSAWLFFGSVELDAHAREHARPALLRGDVVRQSEHEYRFHPLGGRGDVHLWIPMDTGFPPRDRMYVIGADISAGTGASNSSLSVVDTTTREKVCELTSAIIRPESFAVKAVEIARLFNGAYLIWECNGGPGQNFGDRVIQEGYRNVYYRRKESALSKKATDSYGFHTGQDTKDSLLYSYRDALEQGRFINHSLEAIQECRKYVRLPNGHAIHLESIGADDKDPSGAASSHGDRVIADALANFALEEITRRKIQTITAPVRIPPGCLMARRLERGGRLAEESMPGQTKLRWFK